MGKVAGAESSMPPALLQVPLRLACTTAFQLLSQCIYYMPGTMRPQILPSQPAFKADINISESRSDGNQRCAL